jgi:hypothetical protein
MILGKLKKKDAEAYRAKPSRKPLSPCRLTSKRRPAQRHQRCRQDCRPGSAAHYQRTHGFLPGLRSLDKKKNETIAVYDLGGGTFDVSILEVGDGVSR